MRNTLCALALTGFLAVGLTCSASAQTDSTPSTTDQSSSQTTSGQTTPDQSTMSQSHHRMHHHEMNADRDLARMTKRLNLTQDEQTQIKPILQDRDQQLNQLWQDNTMSKADRRSKSKQIHEDANAKIKPILTPEQQQKMESMMMHHHHHKGSMQSTDQTQPGSPQ